MPHGQQDSRPSQRRSEHFVLTTIVMSAQWQASPDAVLASVHTTLRERAGQRGLLLHGQPTENIEVLHESQRVRITLSVEATPAQQ